MIRFHERHDFAGQFVSIEINPDVYWHYNKCGHFCMKAHYDKSKCCECARAKRDWCNVCRVGETDARNTG